MSQSEIISNGGPNNLVEYCKLGLMHSPSGRLLTSETFQGSLNVSGTSLKRKQVWTLYTDQANPTAFILQNHLGRYLSADRDGNVSLVKEEPSSDERWLIHFDSHASGELSLQSEAHSFYLEWARNEIRCFSKEPVWWGFRLAIHPQVHLQSVHRSHYIRSANKDSEFRAVATMPSTYKYLFWLEQLPLPNMTSRVGDSGQGSQLTKNAVAKLSKVAIRSQSGRYLCANGSLVDQIDKCTLFTVSFRPYKTPIIMFQNEHGEYLTVGAGGVVKIKAGIREPRREEHFALHTPSAQIRLWAFNKKFACNKHGLSFSSKMEETDEQKSTIYQLEYLGGRGLNMDNIIFSGATPSADSPPVVFPLHSGPDGDSYSGTPYLVTGLWRLRSHDNKIWQIPPTGGVQLVTKETEPHTSFELLYITSYEEMLDDGKTRVCKEGGVVFRTKDDGRIVTSKALGAIGASDKCITSDWSPQESEVFHMLTLINRPSVACYSPFACGYLAPSAGRRGGSGVRNLVDCLSSNPEQWHLVHYSMGTCQMFTGNSEGWSLLMVKGDGTIGLTSSASGPSDVEHNGNIPVQPETLFVICMTSAKYVLLRSALITKSSKSGYLCSSIQGDVKLDTSGTLTPGCIWQI